ncbi:MAG: MauE/DoxX family redox-associated membrane protein [Bacteroidota bacterium]
MEKPQKFSTSWTESAIDNLLLRIGATAFLVLIALSQKLWLTDRAFPLMPAWEGFSVSHTFNLVLLLVLVGLLVAKAVFPAKGLGLIIVPVVILLVLIDLNRLQPWTYILLLLFALSGIKHLFKVKGLVLYGVRILIIGTFLWTGISKLNPHFLENTFLTILTKALKVQDTTFFVNNPEFGYFFGLTEILVALLLLFQKTRILAVCMIVFTHLFICYFVSPLALGLDWIVIPWNLFMASWVVIVFTKVLNPVDFDWGFDSAKAIKYGFTFVVLVLPSLNLIGKWDNFMSFNFFSDKTTKLIIGVESTQIPNLSPEIQKRFKTVPGGGGGQMLDLLEWSFDEINVPHYPEEWVLDRVCKSFCQSGIPEKSIIFLKIKGSLLSKNVERTGCQSLEYKE